MTHLLSKSIFQGTLLFFLVFSKNTTLEYPLAISTGLNAVGATLMGLFGVYAIIFHIIMGIFLIPLYANPTSVLAYQIFNILFILNGFYLLFAAIFGIFSGVSFQNHTLRSRLSFVHLICMGIGFVIHIIATLGVSISLLSMRVTRFGTLMICLYLIVGSIAFLFFLLNTGVQLFLIRKVNKQSQ